MAEVALSIDLGTGGLKVGLVSEEGEVLAAAHRHIETTYVGQGGAEQDPRSWWEAIVEACRELAAWDPSSWAGVCVISVTGQWGSSVFLDEHGEPTHPALLWMDTRGHRYAREVMGSKGISIEGYGIRKVLSFIRKTAGAPALEGNDPLGHYLLVKHERKDAYEKTRLILEPIDYINYRLTGLARSSPQTMILSWLIDIRKLDKPAYDRQLLKLSKREERLLPELVPPGSVIGPISSRAASELSLRSDVQVVTGQADLISAAAGAGAVRYYEPHMAISTTSWISCPVPFKKTDPFRQVATVPGLSTDRYLLANNHETAGLCLAWLKSALFPQASGFEELTSLAEKSPPGSDGVIFAPWLAGERCPVFDRTLRASFLNLSLKTEAEHIVRAVLEGVAFNARWMLQAVEAFLKRRLERIRVIGGGAQSDLWCQIHADVMGVVIERVKDPLYANVKGAGLLGFVYAGKMDLDDVATKVKLDAVFTPQEKTRATYDRLYSEFKGLYKAQKAMYRRLNG